MAFQRKLIFGQPVLQLPSAVSERAEVGEEHENYLIGLP